MIGLVACQANRPAICLAQANGPGFQTSQEPTGPNVRPFARVRGMRKWSGRRPFGIIDAQYPGRRPGLGKWLSRWLDVLRDSPDHPGIDYVDSFRTFLLLTNKHGYLMPFDPTPFTLGQTKEWGQRNSSISLVLNIPLPPFLCLRRQAASVLELARVSVYHVGKSAFPLTESLATSATSI